MTDKMKQNVKIQQKKTYMYVIEGETWTRTFTLDDRDEVINEEGERDCPLENVLRRNHLSLNDLKDWGAVKIQLVERTKETEKVLYEMDADHESGLLK